MPTQTSVPCEGFGLSHIGQSRRRNEDSFFLDPHGRFCIVADGMGGHRGGQEASQMAVAEARSELENLFSVVEQEALGGIEDKLTYMCSVISNSVFNRGQQDANLAEMGSTLILWVRWKNEIYVAHLGDSRAYLIRGGHIFQVTWDHNLFNEQLKEGRPRSWLEHFPYRNCLSRSLGTSIAPETSVIQVSIEEGDRWLLCTDGLTREMTPLEIMEEMSGESDIEKACHGLVLEAWARGGADNITAVLLEFQKKKN